MVSRDCYKDKAVGKGMCHHGVEAVQIHLMNAVWRTYCSCHEDVSVMEPICIPPHE